MKAIRYYGPEDLRLDNIPEPPVGPTQVKVKVAWCGVCGTDLHIYHGEMKGSVPEGTEPHPITGATLPVVLGHEFSGTIVELGSDVDPTRYAVGQNVTVEPCVSCRQSDCPACCNPNTCNQCPRLWCVGVSGGGGGYSEYVAVNQELVHVLPPNVPLDVGALVEPLAVAWRATKRANIKAGDKVLILGAGPIAIFMIHTVKLFGATWVGVSGRRAKRCELARQHGASVVYDLTAPGGVDVAAEVLRETGGRGADVVVDCGGSQSSIDVAVKAARRGGMIMNVAAWTQPPTVDLNTMMYKELTLGNSIIYSNEHPELLQAMAEGRFHNLESLITRRVPLEEFLEKGLKALLNEKDDHVKVLVHP
ncbi:L-threonine 3-dehydrogenase [Cubamyces sp. BRFM 1775]|nr:L-threonine 3-dehydrogenase [Cubamyces sp. BRFM 1775]